MIKNNNKVLITYLCNETHGYHTHKFVFRPMLVFSKE